MGLKNKRGDWFKIVQKRRDEDAKCVKRGLPSKLNAEVFENSDNIKTSDRAEQYLDDHMLRYDEKGNPVVHTERGKRRRARLGKDK